MAVRVVSDKRLLFKDYIQEGDLNEINPGPEILNDRVFQQQCSNWGYSVLQIGDRLVRVYCKPPDQRALGDETPGQPPSQYVGAQPGTDLRYEMSTQDNNERGRNDLTEGRARTKAILRTILQKSVGEKVIPFNKIGTCRVFKSADGRAYWLEGIASDTSVDRDGDRMSEALLHKWENLINTQHVNFHGDHKHGLFDTLGVFREAEVNDGKLFVRARLEDPEINPAVKQLLAKLDAGLNVGLSIGGDLTNSTKEWDGATGQHVRTIKDATLYEISAVGIPANGNAVVLGSVYKSFNPYQYESHYTSECSRVHPGLAHIDYEKVFQRPNSQPAQIVININKSTEDGSLVNPAHFDAAQRGVNPPGRIAAEPGKSGSSEVFRTDTGQKPSIYSDEDEAMADLERFYEELHGTKAEEMPAYTGGPAGVFGQGKAEEDDVRQNRQAGGQVKTEDLAPQMPATSGLGEERRKREPYAGRPGGAMGYREEHNKNLKQGFLQRMLTLQKAGAWVQQMAQEQAQRQGADDAIRDAGDYRDIHEKLHELNQPHDLAVCRHCSPVPSRMDEHLANPTKQDEGVSPGTDLRLVARKTHGA